MAQITVLQGHASRLSQSVALLRTGRLQTVPVAYFLVGRQPVRFVGVPSVREGDRVTVAGLHSGAEFRALAMRNDSTSVEHLASVGGFTGAALLLGALALLMLVGVPVLGGVLGAPALLSSLGVLMSVPFALSGVLLVVQGRRNHKVNGALRTTPALSQSMAERELADAAEDDDVVIARLGERPSVIAAIARGIVGIIGIAFIGMALLLFALIVHDVLVLGELGRGAAIFASIIASGVGIGGVALVRWGFRGRPRGLPRSRPHRRALRRRGRALALWGLQG